MRAWTRQRIEAGARAGVGAALAAAAALAGLAPARAASVQTTFQVSATVVPACSVSAAPLAFGNYDPTAAGATDGAATIEVTCTNGAPYTIGLNEGAGGGATIAARKMALGGATLLYALYQDSARNTLWGDTIGADTVAGSGTGAPQTYSVYGRIPPAQPAPAGTYTDTVTVTVTF